MSRDRSGSAQLPESIRSEVGIGVASGGVGGGILMVIVGLIKQAMGGAKGA